MANVGAFECVWIASKVHVAKQIGCEINKIATDPLDHHITIRFEPTSNPPAPVESSAWESLSTQTTIITIIIEPQLTHTSHFRSATLTLGTMSMYMYIGKANGYNSSEAYQT